MARHALGVLGVVAAGILLAVSAAMNYRFGFSLGKTALDGQIYGAAMPSWAQLSDVELSVLGTFVLQKLNGAKLKVPEATIKEARAAPLDVASLKQLRDGD